MVTIRIPDGTRKITKSLVDYLLTEQNAKREDLQYIKPIPDCVKKIGKGAFKNCLKLKGNSQCTFLANNVVEIDDDAFLDVMKIRLFDAQKLEYVGDNAFTISQENYNDDIFSDLQVFYAPNLSIIGNKTFQHTINLTYISTHKLIKTGHHVFGFTGIREFIAPELVSTGEGIFMVRGDSNDSLHKFYAPKLKVLEAWSLHLCSELRELNLESAEIIREGGLSTTGIDELDLPNVHTMEYNSLGNCFHLRKVNMPKFTSEFKVEILGDTDEEECRLKEVNLKNCKLTKEDIYKNSEVVSYDRLIPHRVIKVT